MSFKSYPLESFPLKPYSSIFDTNKDDYNWVFIHGWGSDNSLWEPLRQFLPGTHYGVNLPGFGGSRAEIALSFKAYLEEVSRSLPTDTIVVGWSLGGTVATALAELCSIKVKALITVAHTPKFVQSEDWPHGMEKPVFDRFTAGFAAKPEKTWKRFLALQSQGEPDKSEILGYFKSQLPPGEETVAGWQQGLDWLESFDVRDQQRANNLPALHLLAERDALVPSGLEGYYLGQKRTRALIYEGCGHALHLSKPKVIAADILSWLDECAIEASKNKVGVARSFSRASQSYDQAASFQKKIAKRLLRLIAGPIEGLTIDLGSGTGFISEIMDETSTKVDLLQLDLSEAMLQTARKKSANGSSAWIAADAESLPLVDACASWMVSSMSLQWCSFGAVLTEVRRVLVLNGHFAFAIPVNNSLTELKKTWGDLDGFDHVNTFPSREGIEQVLLENGFEILSFEQSVQQDTYDDFWGLLKGFKNVGANWVNGEQKEGLMGKSEMRRLAQKYEVWRNTDGKLPVSYDMVFAIVRKREKTEFA